MSALTAVLAFVAIVIIIVVVWYFTYGFGVVHKTIFTSSSTTTTISSNHVTNTSTTTTIYLSGPCQTLSLLTANASTTQLVECAWTGGPLGVWVESGNAQYEHATIRSTSNVTYLNQSSSYQCITFYRNVTLPANSYIVSLTSGPPVQNQNASPSCPYTGVILNTTLSPPKKVYNYFYNGNFSNGEYTGWNISGTGFGSAPLNLTYANVNPTSPCFIGSEWRNYVGSYAATTYNCGLGVAPGNITSSTFIASKAFLNFRLVSPQDNLIYVEILYNNTPYIIAHYNTYNISLGTNASSTFRNASIPLVTVYNKPVQVRVVAVTLRRNNYIAIGDFALSSTAGSPTKGILVSLNFSS